MRTYYRSILPNLYFAMMWAFLTVAAGIFVDDLVKGMGIVSALSLFYITRMNYFKEFYSPKSSEQEQND